MFYKTGIALIFTLFIFSLLRIDCWFFSNNEWADECWMMCHLDFWGDVSWRFLKVEGIFLLFIFLQGNVFQTAIYNQTVTITEREEGLDGET